MILSSSFPKGVYSHLLGNYTLGKRIHPDILRTVESMEDTESRWQPPTEIMCEREKNLQRKLLYLAKI